MRAYGMAGKHVGGGGRGDRRFKDPDAARLIVSEKRLTFFMPEVTFRALRLQAGYFQVRNAEGEETDDPLPESPSGLVREAIEFWLDQFLPAGAAERSRTDGEWSARLDLLRAALKKG
ncbi:MAG: hypothetical protein AB7K09_13540 [Planctomycetota bacterium]